MPYLSRMVKCRKKLENVPNEKLAAFAAKKISTFQLQEHTHKRNGHQPFLKECPDCRAGAIKQPPPPSSSRRPL